MDIAVKTKQGKSLPAKHNPYLHDLIWGLLEGQRPGKLLDIPAGPGYFSQRASSSGFSCLAALALFL